MSTSGPGIARPFVRVSLHPLRDLDQAMLHGLLLATGAERRRRPKVVHARRRAGTAAHVRPSTET
jgi:hypothetical protein